MPSSSGRSGRAKAAREPDRHGQPGGEGTGDDGDTGTPAGDRTDRPDRAGERGTPAGGGRSARGERGPRGARRRKRRRSPAQEASGQVRRRPRRMRTVDETSAGGLVVDTATGAAALIGRLDRRGRLLWSLPKGHIEAGETAEQAAVREVAEETGINSAVIAALGSIEYWFVADDRRVHKTVHHFLLRALGGELSDADFEVTEVAWVPLPDLQERLAYADERRLVRHAAELLAESA